ncbi:PTS lactose/cellobiose transporter subunit IIA [Liquorilactobacillus sicerae]|uniref:PTS lactose/cellobiose transporter subunit IIA n=1 Tax=Liquorilactobacillus sicerae TaxID=1416943 RepID=UPI0024804B5F|nr:PTS lactose/cellobiose transporter subunit IIA [Liquorilactobacillus sicerae]
MEDQNELKIIMGLIINGGNAKGAAVEAIRAAKRSDFATAQEKLDQADRFLKAAHDSQTNLLSDEADGKPHQVSLLLIHGQDHLMNAITFRDLAAEIIELYQQLGDFKDSK